MIIEVFCDGASRGQGQKKVGEAACAVTVYKNRKKIAQFARGLGPRGNNEAEYEAVISGLLFVLWVNYITQYYIQILLLWPITLADNGHVNITH